MGGRAAFDCGGWVETSFRPALQEAALAAADSVDPLAARIGAVNTLVRQPDGTLRGYNTDCGAALDAIEAGLAGVGGTADDRVSRAGAVGRDRAMRLACLGWSLCHAAGAVTVRGADSPLSVRAHPGMRFGTFVCGTVTSSHCVGTALCQGASELITSPPPCPEAALTRLVLLVAPQDQKDAPGSSQRPASGGPLDGKTVVVVGAGGAGRALAFGAVDRGAQVFCRTSW